MIQKILFSTLILTALASVSQAQDSTSVSDPDEISTLFSNDISYGGFGSYMMEFSLIDEEIGVLNGGGGGVLMNRRFFLGGFGLSSNDLTLTSVEEYDRVQFGYGGVWMGYYFFPESAVHVGLDAKLGWGAVNYSERGWRGSRVTDAVYVVNPSLQIGMNVTQWFKMNVGAGYRWVSGTAPGYLSSNKLSQPNVNVSFNFGWFE